MSRMVQRIRSCCGAAALVLLVACSETSSVVTEEPEPATMEIRIDGGPVTRVDEHGGVTGPALQLSSGQGSTIEATFRNAAGAVVASNSSDFQLQVTPGNSAMLQFTRTGPLRGTLLGTTAGTTQIRLSLRHLSQGHDDFPASFLAVSIAP